MKATVAEFRSFYARHIAAKSGDPHVVERLTGVLSSVERERFLENGPWRILTPMGYIETPNDDSAFLYQDVVVALSREGPFNNGEPSLHARCLAAANPTAGETVMHVGAGTGYYTAILAALVGPTGSVTAYEIEDPLAARATANLATLSNVRVVCQSGAQGPLSAADVIYVNAGATAPLRIWLDALRPGGRLLFPLTPAEGIGAVLLVTRRNKVFSVRTVSPAMFIPCIGARDDDTAQRLTVTFQRQSIDEVRSLRHDTPVANLCWFAGDGWWLSTAPIE